MIYKKESETKVVLKPVCNVIGVIFGHSKAKDKNVVNCVTLRLQTFGTRLCYKIYSLIINVFLAQRGWDRCLVPTSLYIF